MSEESPTINISLTKGEDPVTKLLQDASTIERYVIVTQESLQQKVTDQLENLCKMEAQVSDLEEESDHADKRNNHLKHLLKNFNETCKMNMSITTETEYMLNRTRGCLFNYEERAHKHIRILSVCMLAAALAFVEYYPAEVYIPVIGLVSINVAFIISMIANIPSPVFPEATKKIKDLKTEIRKTSVTNDYITDFIDLV